MSTPLTVPEKLDIIVREYRGGLSLKDTGNLVGLSPTGVRKILLRNGITPRTPLDVGPIQGAKRSGAQHWTARKPPHVKPKTYRSMRITDADGHVHKRRRHVILMEQHIGRRLLPTECVHHINGDRHDNRLENLQLMNRSDHSRYEVMLARIKWPGIFDQIRDPLTGRFIARKAAV